MIQRFTILLEAAGVGLLGFPIDEKYGGSNGNNIDIMVVLEELAAVDGGMATVIGDTWFAMTPIVIAADSGSGSGSSGPWHPAMRPMWEAYA